MTSKVYYRCSDSPHGIFSAIYDIWKEQKREGRYILLGKTDDLELFAEYQDVQEDQKKVCAVEQMIKKNLGEQVYKQLYYALLASDSKKADAVLGTMIAATKIKSGKLIMNHLSHKDVQKVFELDRSVGHEAHIYTGFVRFRELSNHILYAKIEPTHRVLTCIAEHFTDRFPMENFVIHDSTYNESLVHRAGGTWVLVQNQQLNEQFLQGLSTKQDEFEQLWKGFFKSISITERESRTRQNRHVSYKKRKNMVEFDERDSENVQKYDE